MTKIVVTLDNNADSTFLRSMIENMKGVVKATLVYPDHRHEQESSRFLDSIHAIKKDINPDAIDMSDPRTDYIMSK